MQSDPHRSIHPRPSRPAYLVLALVIGWTFGIGGVMSGCGLLRFYQEPGSRVEVHESNGNPGFDAYFEHQNEALNENQDRMVPLAVADVLLSALLIVACARALAAKQNAHILAIQAVAANIVYTLVDYVVSAPIRAAVIASARPPAGQIEPLDSGQFAAAVTWAVRTLSAAQVVILGLVIYALTRPRVIAFFRAGEGPPKEEA